MSAATSTFASLGKEPAKFPSRALPEGMLAAPPISGYGQPTFRLLPHTKKRGFTAENHCDSPQRFLWHYHPEWEIVYIHKGSGTRHVGMSVEKFGPGDLVMLPGNVPHAWFSGSDQIGDMRFTVIHFQPQVWGASFWQLPEIGAFHDLCQRAQRGVRFIGEAAGEIGQRMNALAENDSPSLESLMELWKIFSLLTKLDVHSLNAVEDGKTVWKNERLDGFLTWLQSRLGEPMTQQEAADKMKMSPAAFSRWFKTNMGCVFHRYLNEIRVARVCSDIAQGKLSITEAAFQAGYHNLSNFNRRFREVTGVTPKAFRVQIQQTEGRKVRSA